MTEPDPAAPRDPGHWGQFGQEDIFPAGTALELRPYKAPRPGWDHDHCIFCWEKFIESGSSTLTAGYTAEPADEWVCPSCFEEFAERFGWAEKSA